MKGQVLHITFHNPNTISDSEKIAGEFISRAATGVLTKMILDNQEKRTLTNNSGSESALDQEINRKHTLPERYFEGGVLF